MRPVVGEKSTDARPTPTSVGPRFVPRASEPWQMAQSARNVCSTGGGACGDGSARAVTVGTANIAATPASANGAAMSALATPLLTRAAAAARAPPQTIPTGPRQYRHE